MITKITMSCIFLITFLGCEKVEYTDIALEHHAYIWNRKTSDKLSENIRYGNGFLKGYSILAAEVNWANGNARVKTSEIPKEKHGLNSISIRINDFSGNIVDKSESIIEVTLKSLNRFKSCGFKIDEVQIDFDCPTSKLENYASLLTTLKSHFKEKLSITALPSWLRHGSFKKVLKTCDNYVLQLHSLTLPKNINTIYPLFNKDKAESWINQAAKLGQPFSISLPTYGYFLGFDERGNYLGVSSEQGPKNWPQTRVLLTNSQSISNFIRNISTKRPKLLKSVYWFRLYKNTDTLNWNVDAVRSIVLGKEIHTAQYEVSYKKQNESLTDISLRNSSSTPVVLPKGLKLTLKQNDILFADVLKHFKIDQIEKHSVTVITYESVVIPPGKSLALGWIRHGRNYLGQDKS